MIAGILTLIVAITIASPAVAQERELLGAMPDALGQHVDRQQPTPSTGASGGIDTLQTGPGASAADSPFADPSPVASKKQGIAWGPVLGQSLSFLTLQHLARFTEERTRSELGGPFFEDWFESVASMDRFHDNGKFLTNWVTHPMMGSASAFILGQNDPEYVSAKVGSDQYWRAKRKQFLFATAYSVQFELGPLSESSLGNLHQGAIDLVLTPTIGIVWSVGEDFAAQHILRPLRANHPKWANTLAIFLNPTRSWANLMAFKRPWACDVASCR